MKRTDIIIFAGTLVVIAVGSFAYLNTGTEVVLGWTDPAQIGDQKFSTTSLTYYCGELWLAIDTHGRIEVIHSQDGVEWSSPFILVEKSPGDCAFPFGVGWLKRLDGELWFFWTGGREDEGCPEVLFYSALRDDETWSVPQEIHRLNDDCRFRAVENSLEGGLVVLEDCRHSGYAVIHGEEVPASIGNAGFVQSSNENSEWNPPFLFTSSTSPRPIDILLKNEGILYLIYRESGSTEGVYLRTSEDGISWSSPQKTSLSAQSGGRFLQQDNGRFVFFFYGDPDAIYMSVSADTSNWSTPVLVAQTERIGGLSATESDDGTLWVAISGRNGVYLTHYSDEKYLEDSQVLQNIIFRNGVIALSISALIGVILLFLYKVVSRHET